MVTKKPYILRTTMDGIYVLDCAESPRGMWDKHVGTIDATGYVFDQPEGFNLHLHHDSGDCISERVHKSSFRAATIKRAESKASIEGQIFHRYST